MENQHRKITGYRELSQEEIDLMNTIKAKGEELALLISEVEDLKNDHMDIDKILDRIDCVEYAKKDLKQGIMWLVRSVALPNSF